MSLIYVPTVTIVNGVLVETPSPIAPPGVLADGTTAS